ncbi:coiled-coil domain-containing protein 116 [Podarcis raffonei]|uniref:coiled-coil domain-containing protein 116 n=1 Tax=Podarcis raffonei TaxID=65483 RepID=UPI0023299C26|nr:coiled-coil domain-containing protein 116 [Podarcis raffonei]
MESRRYSGYLADDESLRGPQLRQGDPSDWRNILRPPSRCQFRDQFAATTASEFKAFSPGKGKRKQRSSSHGESSHLANEFSEFVDFLADEEVLESLQNIVEDAVRKLRRVTTEDGDPIFDIEEESGSSMDSRSWSFSCSSQSRYHTTSATSSSEDDWEACLTSRREPRLEGKMSLLDKYAARLPRLDERPREGVSGGFHAETFSERSGDSYYFRQEHFHIWAKLAESFTKLHPPHRDYFAKFRKQIPKQTMSVESLHKEITSVLKRPTPSSIPLYYPGNEPFSALDFLEENKILAALQCIINQAVLKVLEVTMADGFSFVGTYDEQGHPLLPWASSMEESEEGEEEEELRSGSADSESGEDTSEEGDSKSEEGKEGEGGKKKKKKKKGKKKKDKGKEKEKEKEKDKEREKRKKAKGESITPSPEEKGKPKYTPPVLPKSKRKSMGPEEAQRKPKYVPPPLPKTKPRPPPEEPPPKPKYVPPPLPKPRQKKDSTQGVAESKQPAVSRRIISPSDIKRARLQGKPLPKQAIIDFLIENAAKLILYKYNYETLLSEKLGFISVPVTKVLLEIMFGYKRVKGSGIRLSSQIDWSKVHDEIYAPRKPRPKTPKQKDKKKGKKKRVLWDLQKKSGEKKSVLFKSDMPTGKVVVMKSTVEKEVKSGILQKIESSSQQAGSQETDIFDIVALGEGESEELSVEGEGLPDQFVSRRSITSEDSKTLLEAPDSEDQSPLNVTPKASSSQKLNIDPDGARGSGTVLPEVGAPSQNSGEHLKKQSSSRRSSLSEEGSKTHLPKI